MSAHTPGPWEFKGESKSLSGFKVRGTIVGGKYQVANCPFIKEDGIDYFKNEAEANATLIAAAPDLLAALKNIVSEIRAYGSPECDDEDGLSAGALKIADAAIAKAEGSK